MEDRISHILTVKDSASFIVDDLSLFVHYLVIFKQIVGGSLKDAGNVAVENYISRQDADYYATMYKKDGLTGGHIILLNPPSSEYYDATKAQALKALHAYPGGMQIGGGITAENAAEYLEEGASHVIVTSYVFQDGQVRYDRLDRLKKAVGKEHLVLDLSCRRRENSYYIVTNRWQTFTELRLIPEVLEELSGWCDGFLVHGVDVEGKASGTEQLQQSVPGIHEPFPSTQHHALPDSR